MIYGTTDSGMQYAVRRGGSAVGYCSLSVKCGTRDEEGFHSGIAHFAEHTIFKGTAYRNAAAINGCLDKLGGELNAYTTKEEIVLHATVLKEDLPKAAKLLLELATSPTFPENEINTEKSVVIDEINSYKDAPSEEIYDRFEELLFEGHPLAGPILGTCSSVRKITGDELHRFVKEKFTPENMAFTVVADIDEKKMEDRVRKLSDRFFSNTAGQEHACEETTRKRVCQTPGTNVFDKTVNKRNHQVNCIVGATGPSLYDEKERVAAILLCNILGGPASNSILNSVLREKKGWVYGVECSYTQYADTGIVAICLGCDRENLDKCLDVIAREVGKIQTVEFSETRMKAFRKQLLGQLAISSDNGETQCLSMGKSLLAYGKVTDGEETRKKIEAVTAKDIQEAAKTIFAKDRLSRLIFL